jgi:hypothetical protein
MPERNKMFRKLGRFPHSIAALTANLHTVKTNEPLSRKKGDIAQADLQRDEAKEFRSAIKFLGKGR